MNHLERTLFLGIEKPKRSILFPPANRKPWIISTFLILTRLFGRKVTAFCRSGEEKVGKEVREGGEVERW